MPSPKVKEPRRPPIRCRQTEPDEQLWEPGTIVHTTDGVTVYLGDDASQVDVETLAARVRQTRRIELVGGKIWVAKTVKFAIVDAWNRVSWALQREAREKTAKALMLAREARCGRPRADGQPCRRPAGACTDHPGTGPCHHHDDQAAKLERDQALNEQLDTFVRLRDEARERPLSPRERLDGLVALRAVLVEVEKQRRRRKRRGEEY